MTAASASRLCGRLADAGLLLRRPHERDSRSTVLALTPAGGQVVGTRREDVLATVGLCLHGAGREREALRAALVALHRGLREEVRIAPDAHRAVRRSGEAGQ
jgi:DNA-binding MarR family transcriptional regulator